MGWFSKSTEMVERVESFDATPANILPPARGDFAVSPSLALSLITVYRCVALITNLCSQLSLKVTRDGQELPTPAVILQPDYNRSRRDFIKRAVFNLATKGECFILVTYSGRGEAKNFEILANSSVSIEYDKQGNKVFKVAYANGTKTYSMREVKHCRLLEDETSVNGLGPIQAAVRDIRGAINLRDYASNFLADGGLPTGVISTDFQTDELSAAQIQEAWYKSLERELVQVMPPGWKFTPLGINPADLLYLEQAGYNDRSIARLFGVPGVLLDLPPESGSSLTYQNVEGSVEGRLVTHVLADYLTAISDALSSALPRGQEVSFDTAAWLRRDLKTRLETYAVGINAGIYTADEVRDWEGLPPLPEPEPAPVEPEPETDPGEVA